MASRRRDKKRPQLTTTTKVKAWNGFHHGLLSTTHVILEKDNKDVIKALGNMTRISKSGDKHSKSDEDHRRIEGVCYICSSKFSGGQDISEANLRAFNDLIFSSTVTHKDSETSSVCPECAHVVNKVGRVLKQIKNLEEELQEIVACVRMATKLKHHHEEVEESCPDTDMNISTDYDNPEELADAEQDDPHPSASNGSFQGDEEEVNPVFFDLEDHLPDLDYVIVDDPPDIDCGIENVHDPLENSSTALNDKAGFHESYQNPSPDRPDLETTPKVSSAANTPVKSSTEVLRNRPGPKSKKNTTTEPDKDVNSESQSEKLVDSCRDKPLSSLKKHIRSHKNRDTGLFHCPKCSKRFSKYSMIRKHIRISHIPAPRPFKCDADFCESSFETLDSLKLHQLIHSGDQEFACSLCGKQFTNRDNLRQHIRRMHEAKNKMLEIYQSISKDKKDEPTPAPPKVKCSICHKSFFTKERLEKHMVIHSDEDKKPLECSFCFKRFVTNSALASHFKTHAEGGKFFDCPMCNFSTPQLYSLTEHVQTHKSRDTGLFDCPKCPKKYAAYSMIRKHIRAFHGTRQFNCDVCDSSFLTPDKLKLHRLRHSDFRAFTCTHCGKQFKRKDKLREHTKRIHEKIQNILGGNQQLISEDKNPKCRLSAVKLSPEEIQKFLFKCLDCMVGFNRRGMLVNHLAKRHPEKTLNSIPELNQPILRLTLNYPCLYCKRVYQSSSKRKSHILKTHRGRPLPPTVRASGGTVKAPELQSSSKEMNTGAEIQTVAENGDPLSGITNKTNNTQNNLVSTTSTSQTTRKEAKIVGKVAVLPQPCQWCHRQYASRAKLLQHQRKAHLSLMPSKLRTPRIQKNNSSKTVKPEDEDPDSEEDESF